MEFTHGLVRALELAGAVSDDELARRVVDQSIATCEGSSRSGVTAGSTG